MKKGGCVPAAALRNNPLAQAVHVVAAVTHAAHEDAHAAQTPPLLNFPTGHVPLMHAAAVLNKYPAAHAEHVVLVHVAQLACGHVVHTPLARYLPLGHVADCVHWQLVMGA